MFEIKFTELHRQLSFTTEVNSNRNVEGSKAIELHLESARWTCLHIHVIHTKAWMKAKPDFLYETICSNVLIFKLHEHGPLMIVGNRAFENFLTIRDEFVPVSIDDFQLCEVTVKFVILSEACLHLTKGQWILLFHLLLQCFVDFHLVFWWWNLSAKRALNFLTEEDIQAFPTEIVFARKSDRFYHDAIANFAFCVQFFSFFFWWVQRLNLDFVFFYKVLTKHCDIIFLYGIVIQHFERNLLFTSFFYFSFFKLGLDLINHCIFI